MEQQVQPEGKIFQNPGLPLQGLTDTVLFANPGPVFDPSKHS